jgi:DNA gyrase subunit B
MAKKDPSTKPNEYKADSIRVIEGLEAVRKRPAMYIGSTGPAGLHHLVYEVVDNSVDEALGGHCDSINVILHKDGSCSVEDNGRGIPTGIHQQEKISAAEVVLTKLHAGGKFDKDSYKFSGGLHGVGISVVNALSETLQLTIFQDGKIHEQLYKRGKPQGRLTVTGDTDKRGTLVRFMPDPEIFQETTDFSFDTLSVRLRELAFLNKGLHIVIEDERHDKKNDFFFEGGIVSFVQHINKKKIPLFPEVIYFHHEDEQYVVEIAMQYNDGYGEQVFSFVNNINTVEGGTHVSGFRAALTKECNKRALDLKIVKSGEETFSSEDVREGIVAVISIKVPEPQFEGQTKTKLGNNDIKGIVDSLFFNFLESFFEENPAIAKKILQKAEIAKQAREAARKARDLTRRKTVLENAVLPGKLADCSNEDATQTEMFIVEGDSAGGSAKQARDRHNQAVLPLRGKILNVEKARLDRILSNEEIKSLIAAIGAGVANEFDPAKARYHKIILMTDADVDGSHIRTLLLTFFFRYMQPLIEKGYLYIAKPPLYKAKIGKKEQYLQDEREFKQFLLDWAHETTEGSIDGQLLPHTKWIQLLEGVKKYNDKLEEVSLHFHLGYDQCNKFVNALRMNPWKKQDGIEKLIENLQKSFSDYTITLGEHTPQNIAAEEGTETTPEPALIFNRLSSTWDAPLAFFNAPRLEDLIALLDEIAVLEEKQWTISIIGKTNSIEGQGALKLAEAIGTISKPFMNIQRYKGLGEMNPEQLWETSMDKNSRKLLKVSIEDALEADRWFATLMGDDVGGRRAYIEEFGQFVKNLDV